MKLKLCLGVILAGLFSMPLLAAAGSVSASITIPAALDVQLSMEALALPDGPHGVAELPIEIATNDWPLFLTMTYGYDVAPAPTPGLALWFVADAVPEETAHWWRPQAATDVFAQTLTLSGRQTYQLIVQRLDGVDDADLPISLTLILESRSGRVVMCTIPVMHNTPTEPSD